nr:hypothetical protein [Variovorax boronicumulans]
MTTKPYEIRFLNLSGLDAPELQRELGPSSKTMVSERPDDAYGDLTLLTVAVILSAKALTAALIYFGRKQRTTNIRLSIQVVRPDGTTANVAIEVATNDREALSDQAIKQIASALSVKPSDLAMLE